MLKRIMLILALVVGALALSPAPGSAVPFGTTTAAVAAEGSLAAEPARYRRYRPYGYRYYRPRRSYARRYYQRRRYWY